MNNLPLFSTVCNHVIYHDGNHGHEGRPHDQYIGKWQYNFTRPIEENNNKFYKIAKFDVEKDTNENYFYQMELYSFRAKHTFNFDIVFGNVIGEACVRYEPNEYFQLVYSKREYKVDGKKNRFEVIVYVKPYKTYDQLLFRVTGTSNIVREYYPLETAYKGITLYSWENPLDTISDGVTATDISRIVYQSQTWGETTIQPNSKLTINITTNTTLKWDDFVSYCIVGGQQHSDIIYSPPALINNGANVIITLFNPTSIAKTVPSHNYLLRYEKRTI